MLCFEVKLNLLGTFNQFWYEWANVYVSICVVRMIYVLSGGTTSEFPFYAF